MLKWAELCQIKMNKNFGIVGTPRSGTTFVCDVLNKFDDIWIPEFPNYEPFNPHNLHRLANSIKNNSFDQDLIIKKFISLKYATFINQ